MGAGSELAKRYFGLLSAGEVEQAVSLIADGGNFPTPMGSMSEAGPGTPTPTPRDHPTLGWSRSLPRKATTPDDWSQPGPPHPHGDNATAPPMLSWHRFDLIDSSYAVALMADITPAWREVYSR